MIERQISSENAKVWSFMKLFLKRMNLGSVEHFLIISFIKIRFSVIKTLERHSLNVKKCLSNVLITGESNFDERNGQEMFN